MTPHTHVTSTTTGAPVPVKVEAALADLDEQYQAAAAMPRRTETEQAARAARLALVCARRAGWWRMLQRHAYHDRDTFDVYGRAAMAARDQERSAARFWRQAAHDWTARAHGDRHGSGLWATWDHLQPRGAERGAVA